MSGFVSSLAAAALAVTLSFVILVFVVNPPPFEPSVDSIEIHRTNRHLAYSVRGDKRQPNCVIWLHGLLSSRFESLAISEEVLRENSAFIISFDRPGYGESTFHKGRDFNSSAEDIAALATSIGANRFFIVGVSAGGPYAWAAASLLSSRVRGVLLISSAGPQELESGSHAPRETEVTAGRKAGYLKQIIGSRVLSSAVLWLSETYVGGRALYSLWLEGAGQTILTRMQEVDSRCIMKEHRTAYTLKILPESMRQGVATPVIQDLLLVLRPWPFNISTQIPEQLASHIHIWHGSDDKLVPVAHAHAFKQKVPSASLDIVPNGGHIAFWACDQDWQHRAFSRLIQTGLPKGS